MLLAIPLCHAAAPTSEMPQVGLVHGTCLVGNGRSVLGSGAGPAVDGFEEVVRASGLVQHSRNLQAQALLWRMCLH